MYTSHRYEQTYVITNDLTRDHRVAFAEPRAFVRWRSTQVGHIYTSVYIHVYVCVQVLYSGLHRDVCMSIYVYFKCVSTDNPT